MLRRSLALALTLLGALVPPLGSATLGDPRGVAYATPRPAAGSSAVGLAADLTLVPLVTPSIASTVLDRGGRAGRARGSRP